ncbi:MAG: response regulator transcription factor [Aeromicrobium sp.]
MRVVVVDDEKRLVELIVSYLAESGIEAEGFSDGRAGLAASRAADVDAVILDLMLPGIGGIEVCRRLRREGNNVPVLMLTAKGSVDERVAGLDAGADDYLVKPFALEELTARLRVFQRRNEVLPDDRLVVGDLVMDPLARRAWSGDIELNLARREFDVLETLMDNVGHVVSRDYILEEVWKGESDIRSNTIEVHISKLRSHLDQQADGVAISTVRGVGYRLEKP